MYIEHRKRFYLISSLIILVGLGFMCFNVTEGRGLLNYGIEFKGGTLIYLDLGTDFDIEVDIRPLAETHLFDTSAVIQTTDIPTEIIITTQSTLLSDRTSFMTAIKQVFPDVTILEEESFSPTISPEITAKAVQAVILSSVLMLIYIWIRFQDFKFGTSAVIALIHDVLVMLTVYAVFRIPINNSFIAAMLTIIGYSINDTIIVFDRIRENRKLMQKEDNATIINKSIKQTLSRSINTSLTTLIVVLLLYIIGTDAVKEFAFPLVVGILSGTYSSIFIASPVWYEMRKNVKKEA
ncbi:protein-export membrane protein SecF [Candidatus Epulonipiscium fishelsonii]|uniref:Protein-export membrane protein SecF n=1 Tax=Candidatus Epulonipiscium fishelsonii TaxID=77094 RepID=A0ACC8XAZ3_9FIRM|nr:protein-export membrane protein SecF [Epulopiscium sp. SCG-B05WGA-EpuloA1]ONI39700.1 protein-export membrane protein SecF [Epulopiscium sp. SCG-B11WGA-EpuloA1]ONI46864.1 protein-export membrane protein SecF [Epulopiscium sp. SCG-C06WGA-EpuloA1]